MARRKIRTLAEEKAYSSPTMPSLERRCLMESGMRRPTTRLDVVVVVLFLLVLVVLLGYFLPGFFGHPLHVHLFGLFTRLQ